MDMTEMKYLKAPCADCGVDANVTGALIVSTVIGPNVLEAICCAPANVATTLDGNTCMARFLLRASAALHAPIQFHGHGYAEVFVDDTHFVKISPAFGLVLA
jgi:hypothetical protein